MTFSVILPEPFFKGVRDKEISEKQSELYRRVLITEVQAAQPINVVDGFFVRIGIEDFEKERYTLHKT